VDENNSKVLSKVFCSNLKKLWRMAVKRQFEVAPGHFVNIDIHYGGDESWLCIMLGLKKAVSAQDDAQDVTILTFLSERRICMPEMHLASK
jgi:hypothetical protein